MTSEALRQLTRTLRGISLLSVSFAVLWVKGSLGWVFGIALFEYLATGLMALDPPLYIEDRPDEVGATDAGEDQEADGVHSVPPQSPFPQSLMRLQPPCCVIL